MIVIETDRLRIRESSGKDFSRIYSMMLSESRDESEKKTLPNAAGAGSALAENSGETAEHETTIDDHVIRDQDGKKTLRTIRDRDKETAPQTILDRVSPDENEELEKYLAYIHTVYPVFGFGLWTVERKEDGEILGRCGLQPIADENSPLGRIELGYLIDRPYRGRGYAFEACLAILKYAFERLELDEVYAVIDEENRVSQKLAQKLGFSKTESDLWLLQADSWIPDHTAI